MQWRKYEELSQLLRTAGKVNEKILEGRFRKVERTLENFRRKSGRIQNIFSMAKCTIDLKKDFDTLPKREKNWEILVYRGISL